MYISVEMSTVEESRFGSQISLFSLHLENPTWKSVTLSSSLTSHRPSAVTHWMSLIEWRSPKALVPIQNQHEATASFQDVRSCVSKLHTEVGSRSGNCAEMSFRTLGNWSILPIKTQWFKNKSQSRHCVQKFKDKSFQVRNYHLSPKV